MDELLQALRSKEWRLNSRRRKVYDGPCHTEVSWLGGPNSAIYEAALRTAPCQHYEFAQLNRSVEMKRHTDGANFKGSLILLLGDFTGGALCFDDGRRITETGVWHAFDGHLPHWVEPFDGERFSIILFNNPSLSRRVMWIPLLRLRRRLLSRATSNETPRALLRDG